MDLRTTRIFNFLNFRLEIKGGPTMIDFSQLKFSPRIEYPASTILDLQNLSVFVQIRGQRQPWSPVISGRLPWVNFTHFCKSLSHTTSLMSTCNLWSFSKLWIEIVGIPRSTLESRVFVWPDSGIWEICNGKWRLPAFFGKASNWRTLWNPMTCGTAGRGLKEYWCEFHSVKPTP